VNTDGYTYPDYLRETLKEKKVTVYNIGKQTHQSSQFLQDVKNSNLLKNIRIDLVILYVGHNDAHTHYQSFEGLSRIRNTFFDFTESTILPKYSILARNISLIGFSNKFKSMYNEVMKKPKPVFHEQIATREQEFRRNLMNLSNYIINHNNPNLQVIVSTEFTNFFETITAFRKQNKLGDLKLLNKMEIFKINNYELLTFNQSLKDLSKENSFIHYFDIEFFSNYDSARLLMDNVHLHPYGNKILGQELADFIRQRILYGKNVEDN
jgi:lysophospholipase L1-like esterase